MLMSTNKFHPTHLLAICYIEPFIDNDRTSIPQPSTSKDVILTISFNLEVRAWIRVGSLALADWNPLVHVRLLSPRRRVLIHLAASRWDYAMIRQRPVLPIPYFPSLALHQLDHQRPCHSDMLQAKQATNLPTQAGMPNSIRKLCNGGSSDVASWDCRAIHAIQF